jgi:hypothetical protein
MTTIAFQRNGRTVIAQVYSRYLEPQGDGKYLEVLFCEDSSGSRYRVPISEVIVQGRKKQVKAKKKGKKARMVG